MAVGASSSTIRPPTRLRRDVPLAPYTTFGIGGPARRYVEAGSSAVLARAVRWGRERRLQVVVLGRGSNILVSDRGFDGLVVRAADGGNVEALPEGRLRAGSGVELAHLIEVALRRGLSGLEHFAGIPSTLGGALWQNLHFLSPDRRRTLFLGDLVEEATLLTREGVRRVGASHFRFGYDESSLQRSGEIVLDATLRLVPGEERELRRVRRANLVWRARRYPAAADRRSAGCVFRNPADVPAARLVDAAGLKGLRVGGAAVSRRHANFVLNLGGATAEDVRTLVDEVQVRVARRLGRMLEPEIAFVGSF
ncbi:MAG: UDP-N-acetylmuramate dehydrogenase [Gaiella sp.]|nr:UDP-N-acetylmuramate dehydrogenase [Gaiella sp.]